MKIIKLLLLTLIVLPLLVSCSMPDVNVLVVPTNKDAYRTVKQISSTLEGINNFEGTKTIELYDNNDSMTTCKITYRMIKNSISCNGKEFNGHMTCSNNHKAELKMTSTSCTEAYGIAIGDKGDEYEVYIGLSDLAMKEKIAEIDNL